MRRTTSVIIGALALACAASLNATRRAPLDPGGQVMANQAGAVPDVPPPVHPAEQSSISPLRVENVRLEAPPDAEELPSALLKFDLINEGSAPATDLVLEISIVEKPAPNEVSGRALVRPFEVRGDIVLRAGYTVNYEMIFRNLSADCNCVANVNVVSFR